MKLAKNLWNLESLKFGKKRVVPAQLHRQYIEIDRMLFKYLSSARPDYGWLCEESTSDIPHYKKNCAFVIDPIDGTRDFIKGGNNWSHSFSVVKNGKVSAAVVYVPKTRPFILCLSWWRVMVKR